MSHSHVLYPREFHRWKHFHLQPMTNSCGLNKVELFDNDLTANVTESLNLVVLT